jgi:hypothetical protein
VLAIEGKLASLEVLVNQALREAKAKQEIKGKRAI